MYLDYEAARMLNFLLDEHGSARIIIVADEGASLESFRWYITEPNILDDDHNLDLRPRTTM
ncbi:hypothetical protein N826_07620 [Skermanella aerolata KACC 11604]|nr:hypothetical protein N826_07620 [Skermanella aerolata KACC 11604]